MDVNKRRYKELGEFLKTRRARISPDKIGIKNPTRRRTKGLRREEIAELAGISVTWYTWLEQGRDIHVSEQVIESLSRVLELDKQERMHLYSLANQPIPADKTTQVNHVSDALQNVLDSLAFSPSIIIDQRWNVIAWNLAACCLFGDFKNMNDKEKNIVWSMFTDEKYRSLYRDWEKHAQGLLGRFRASSSRFIEDKWFEDFIEGLKAESKEFKMWWSLHEIESIKEVYKELNHPVANKLEFEVSKFDVADNSGLRLIIHTPVSGTDTYAKMGELVNRI